MQDGSSSEIGDFGLLSEIDHALGGKGLALLALAVSGGVVAFSLISGKTGISYFSGISKKENPVGFWFVVSFFGLVFFGTLIQLLFSLRR